MLTGNRFTSLYSGVIKVRVPESYSHVDNNEPTIKPMMRYVCSRGKWGNAGPRSISTNHGNTEQSSSLSRTGHIVTTLLFFFTKLL